MSEDREGSSNSSDEEVIVTPAQRIRKLQEEVRRTRKRRHKSSIEEKKDEDTIIDNKHVKSLLYAMLEKKPSKEGSELNEKEKQRKEEESILKQMESMSSKSLTSAQERAKGISYTESMKTTWAPAKSIEVLSPSAFDALRRELHLDVTGESIPPVIPHFQEMRFPSWIEKPTSIQMQGLPTVLSGRDMIGVSYTGSGKTLVFTLPLVLFALEEEYKLPVIQGEGPIGMIICPSRELASQIYDIIQSFIACLDRNGYPHVNAVLCIGGDSRSSQINSMRDGIHILVATPGRLNDLLHSGAVNLYICKFICLDEADRMLDEGFESEMQNMLSYVGRQRQTVLFSATFPKQLIHFAQSSLVRPIIIKVGRAGAANLEVQQDIEQVEESKKVVYVVNMCLNKTPPPVVVFCRNKKHVDDLEEYFLLKGIDAVSLHGDKSQEERTSAMKLFKSKQADVLIATDIAAKGIDFPEINHVINYDMPTEIEIYVHRIGRTGRCGHQGVATTLISSRVSEEVLKDLKHLLIEAKQRVPEWLNAIDNTNAISEEEEEKGCAWCGGLGHRINNCPRLFEEDSLSKNKDYLVNTYGEM